MAGTEQAAPEPKRIQAEGIFGPRKRRRIGVRIDMTPMVDIAFLLLIFFMVTTVFRRPLAMEINMPKPGAKVEVPEKNVMTVFVDKDDSVLMKLGTAPFTSVPWDSLEPKFEENVKANPDLIVLAKIHREARYDDMVNMMDILEDAKLDRFSVVPMEERDVKALEKAKGGEGK
jgi:biopolymer transport protein ExbD